MDKSTIKIVAILAGFALVAVTGLTFVTASGRSGDDRAGFFHGLHRLGQHLHGAGHHHHHHDDPMAELIEQLQLAPEQQQHLEKIHTIMEQAHGGGGRASMAELHAQLVAQFEQGYVETTEVRRTIDEHVEQIRETAYATMDELVALINGLDDRQRGIVREHLQQLHEKRHGG